MKYYHLIFFLCFLMLSSCLWSNYRGNVEYVPKKYGAHGGKPSLDNVKYVDFSELGFVKLDASKNTFISKFELTNWEYNDFLNDVRSKMESYQHLKVDTSKWNSINKSMARRYHEKQEHYPVVNISLDAAKRYCLWLTEQMNDDEKKYSFKFRLPTSNELLQLLKDIEINYDSDYIADYNKFEFNLKLKTDSTLNHAADGYPTLGPVYKLKQHSSGLCSIIGNAAELDDQGYVHGGSWDSFPSEVKSSRLYTEPNPKVGFRLVMEKIKKSQH